MKRIVLVVVMLLGFTAFAEVIDGINETAVGESYTAAISVDTISGRQWIDISNGVQSFLIDANEGTMQDKMDFIVQHLDALEAMDEDYEVEEYFISGSTISMTAIPRFEPVGGTAASQADSLTVISGIGEIVSSMGSYITDTYIGSSFEEPIRRK